jgi:small-conductance mechanosensitive channel
MKRPICSLVLGGLLTAGVMLAQESAAAPGRGAAFQTGAASKASVHRNDDRVKKLKKRLARMTKRYKLTADQQIEIRSILTNEEQNVRLVKSDTFMSRGDKREEMASVHEASQQRIGAILIGQQRHEFDADEQRRAWMEGRIPEPNPGPALNGSW